MKATLELPDELQLWRSSGWIPAHVLTGLDHKDSTYSIPMVDAKLAEMGYIHRFEFEHEGIEQLTRTGEFFGIYSTFGVGTYMGMLMYCFKTVADATRARMFL